MKVVQLGPYPPPQGGVQSHIVGLRRLILARGGSCSVINLTRHRESRETGVLHPTTAWETLVRLWGFRAWVLHLHVGLPSGTKFPRRMLWLGLVCTLLAGRRTIFTFH